MTNGREPLINAVTDDKPKMMTINHRGKSAHFAHKQAATFQELDRQFPLNLNPNLLGFPEFPPSDYQKRLSLKVSLR